MLPIKSYHDVRIIVDGAEYDLFNFPFGLELSCNRVGGFQLWQNDGMNSVLIGGEYNENHFQIKFGENLVFDNKK